MCGIAGLVRFDGQPVLETDVRSMCRVMVHRGPDEEGVFLGAGVGMGMRRLSIIDLSGGQQPVSNEDGSIWVVFNGEIYNYPELREQLARNGHVLRSESDTETIVHLYEDFGPRCVDHLRGMFAFAVWDTRRRELLLARDRLGIKPLYYAELDGGIAFASELKPILQLPEVSRNLDWAALGHLFTFLATPASQSIVDGVRKLEPGRIATASAGRQLRIDRYWDVDFTPDERASEGDLADELRALLRDAVRIHQISDVPLGAFLSGGIDSSAVVATMAGLSTGKVKTFSIGFAEAEYDELAHARRVAEAFGTEHHELVLQPDVVQIAEDLAWYLDEPFGDTSAIPTFMVSKLAAEHVTVVLTGDGGDELFGGYDKYVTEEREREFARLPRPIRKLAGAVGHAMPEGMRGRRFLRHLALDGAERYLDASMMFRADELRKLFQPDAYAHLGRHDPRGHALSHLGGFGSDWMSAIQYCDIHTYLPLDILTKVDRMSMAHSIEARPPLLDHKLVEFAARIPARLKLRDGTTKYLLKRAMRGIVANDIIDRQKHGFAVPLAKWFRGELSNFARDLLFSQRSRERGLFNEIYIERLLQLHQRGRDIDLQLWTLLSLELWCRRVLDAPIQRLETPARATRQRILPAVFAAAS
jgi:asparagine synthase (glutamine-hydrolysing)